MNVLYVSSDLGIPVLGHRGGSIHVRELVHAFRRAGHRVTVASPARTKSPWDEPARLDASLVHVEASAVTDAATRRVLTFASSVDAPRAVADDLRRILYNADLAEALEHRFRDHPPDFVYERCAMYGLAGVRVSEALGVPLVLELNAPLVLEDRRYRRGQALGELAAATERKALTRADAIVVVSAALRDYVRSLGVAAERVTVVPNGVDGAAFRPAPRAAALRARFDLDGEPVIGFVGGYQPWHGVEALPALLERLLPKHPRLRLLVVGDGRGRAEFERRVTERGLAAHVRVTGAVAHDDVPALIREFDVAVAPYPPVDHDFYFSPLKLFEYMGCGAPIVAPRLGQIAEVIRDGETGLLYAPSRADELAAACDRLLTDRELATRLGTAAAAEVRERYTWDRNAAAIARIAEDAIARKALTR